MTTKSKGVLAVLDEVLIEVNAAARHGQITLKHDVGHQQRVRAARVDIQELIEAAESACDWIEEVAQRADEEGEIARKLRAVLARTHGGAA